MASKLERPTFARFVEVGRVVLVNKGQAEEEKGKLAAIVEIIDHQRALIDGPETGVKRQSIAYRNVVLTPYVLKKLPRAAGQTALSKIWKSSGVDDKWAKSAWNKKRQIRQRRAELTDFERFKVGMLKTQRSKLVGKELKKAKSSSA